MSAVLQLFRKARPTESQVETRVVQPATGAHEPETLPPGPAPEPPAAEEKTTTQFPELPEDLKLELDVKELCWCAISSMQERAAQERVLLWLCETLGVQR